MKMNRDNEINFAYIDGANLHKGVKNSNWLLDYRRFYIWLKEKYLVQKAYLFIGLIPDNKELYNLLRRAGFILIFKETICIGNGSVKGNCDADLVLTAVCNAYEESQSKAVLVSSDGDFSCLVKFLLGKNKFVTIISPYNNCSILLKRTKAPIVYINDKKNILKIDYNKKAPNMDETI